MSTNIVPEDPADANEILTTLGGVVLQLTEDHLYSIEEFVPLDLAGAVCFSRLNLTNLIDAHVDSGSISSRGTVLEVRLAGKHYYDFKPVMGFPDLLLLTASQHERTRDVFMYNDEGLVIGVTTFTRTNKGFEPCLVRTVSRFPGGGTVLTTVTFNPPQATQI